jgi:hypothetical protein
MGGGSPAIGDQAEMLRLTETSLMKILQEARAGKKEETNPPFPDNDSLRIG